MPSLAVAASDAAKTTGITLDGVEAWGETSRGCYAAWLAMTGKPATPAALGDQLVRGLTGDPALAGIVVHDVVKPAPGAAAGTLALAFDRAPYRGHVRAQLGRDGKIALLACFWNEREPAVCETACKQLLGGMP